MALAAQTIYLEKLQKVLKDDLTETESKIKGDGNVDTINVLICLKLSVSRLTMY